MPDPLFQSVVGVGYLLRYRCALDQFSIVVGRGLAAQRSFGVVAIVIDLPFLDVLLLEGLLSHHCHAATA